MAVLGSVLLGPGSIARRDVVAVGGRVLRADGSLVLGNVAGQELRWTGSEIRSESDLPGAIVARARLALLGAAAGMLLAIGGGHAAALAGRADRRDRAAARRCRAACSGWPGCPAGRC